VQRSSALFYGTHASVLADVACATRGPILELGGGNHSTPILHKVALRMNRTLVTVDHNPRWLDALGLGTSPFHQTVTINGWRDADFSSEPMRKLLQQRWALVFVDQGNWWGRMHSIRKLRKRASYICIHDWDALSFSSNMGDERETKPFVPAREALYWTEFMPVTMPSDCGLYFEDCTGPPTLLISETHDTTKFIGSGVNVVARASWTCSRQSAQVGGCVEGTLVTKWPNDRPTDQWGAAGPSDWGIGGGSSWGGYTHAQWEKMVGVTPQGASEQWAMVVAGTADIIPARRRRVLPTDEMHVLGLPGPHI
jgi:hypothetical protein